MYDPANNTWTEKAPLPSPRSTAAVTAFENYIYVMSGVFKGELRNEVFLYDPAADSWQTRAPMPEARFISGAAVVKDKIVVITGDWQSDRESKIFIYEPLKDRWHDLGKVPRNFRLAAVASIGDKFYILGGVDLEDTVLNQCLEGTLIFWTRRHACLRPHSGSCNQGSNPRFPANSPSP
jgi:N-acetylneuraminic acid mutarotase